MRITLHRQLGPAGGLIVEFDYSGPDRIPHQAGYIVNPEPFHQLGPMGFDGLNAYSQRACDIFSRISFSNQGQYLTFVAALVLNRGAAVWTTSRIFESWAFIAMVGERYCSPRITCSIAISSSSLAALLGR